MRKVQNLRISKWWQHLFYSAVSKFVSNEFDCSRFGIFHKLTNLHHCLISHLSICQVNCINCIVVNSLQHFLILLGNFYAFKFLFIWPFPILSFHNQAGPACEYRWNSWAFHKFVIFVFKNFRCSLHWNFFGCFKLQMDKATTYRLIFNVFIGEIRVLFQWNAGFWLIHKVGDPNDRFIRTNGLISVLLKETLFKERRSIHDVHFMIEIIKDSAIASFNFLSWRLIYKQSAYGHTFLFLYNIWAFNLKWAEGFI